MLLSAVRLPVARYSIARTGKAAFPSLSALISHRSPLNVSTSSFSVAPANGSSRNTTSFAQPDIRFSQPRDCPGYSNNIKFSARLESVFRVNSKSGCAGGLCPRMTILRMRKISIAVANISIKRGSRDINCGVLRRSFSEGGLGELT